MFQNFIVHFNFDSQFPLISRFQQLLKGERKKEDFFKETLQSLFLPFSRITRLLY